MDQLQIHSDALNYEDIISRINDIYDNCSAIEQMQFLKILEELSDKGYSQTLEQIYLVDFKEVPVSIDRFLSDPYYLGESNDCGNQIYPGWWDVYHSVFDNSRDIYEVILSGATRIGKTSTTVSMMCYMTYLLMCYRNPQRYFGLKEVSRCTIAFANLTKDLAEGVAFREYNDTLHKSPWFCERGTFTNSVRKPVYIPNGNQIELVAASDAAHVLGMQLFAACLVGNTQIVTDIGAFQISKLENQTVNVLQYDYSNSTYCYAPADVRLTKYVDKTIRITLDDGSLFEGTPDHKVMLVDGTYKRLDELSENDEVLSL